MWCHSWYTARNKRLTTHWEDIGDWLNGFVSVLLVLVLGVCSLVYLHVVRPISCHAPSETTIEHVNYVHDACWGQLMLPNAWSTQYFRSTSSYVLYSVLGFYIPYALWQHIAETLIDSLIRTLMKRVEIALDKLDNTLLDRTTTEVANQLVRLIMVTPGRDGAKLRVTSLSFRTRMAKSKLRVGIPWLRLLVKGLYLVNVVIQWLHTYGMIQSHVYMDAEVTQYGSFPHLSTCKLNARSAGAPATDYTLNCALMGNILLYQTYSIFNTWLCFVMIVTVISLLLWIGCSIWVSCRHVTQTRQRLITAHACFAVDSATSGLSKCTECRFGTDHKAQMDTFLELFCQTDGVVLWNLLENRAGSEVADQVLLKCWHLYLTLATPSRSDALEMKSMDAADVLLAE